MKIKKSLLSAYVGFAVLVSKILQAIMWIVVVIPKIILVIVDRTWLLLGVLPILTVVHTVVCLVDWIADKHSWKGWLRRLLSKFNDILKKNNKIH